MLFINKFLPIFLLPIGFSILCIITGLIFRKKILLWYAVLVLWLFSTPAVSDGLMRMVEGTQKRMPVTSVQKADAIVVLSGMLRQIDGAPLGEWGDAVDRFYGGVDLFKAGKAPVIVFTRGQVPWQPNAIPEGDLLAKRALLLGIPQSAICLTSIVGNTADEAVATKKLLGVEKKYGKHIILVTSAYHMSRAQLLFEKAGFKVIPFRVDYQVDSTTELTALSYLPNGESLEKSEKALREIIGWIFYMVQGLMK